MIYLVIKIFAGQAECARRKSLLFDTLTTSNCFANAAVMQFNAMVLGLHEYYKIATNVYLDFDRIAFDVRKALLCRTKSHRSKTGLRSQAFQQFYGNFTGKIFNVAGLALFPINGVKTTPPMCFSPDICNYSD